MPLPGCTLPESAEVLLGELLAVSSAEALTLPLGVSQREGVTVALALPGALPVPVTVTDTQALLEAVVERSGVAVAQLVAQLVAEALPPLLLLPLGLSPTLPVVCQEGVNQALPELLLQAVGVALAAAESVAEAVAQLLLLPVGVDRGALAVALAHSVEEGVPLPQALEVELSNAEGVALGQVLCVAAAALAVPGAVLGEAVGLPGFPVPVPGTGVAVPGREKEAREEALAEPDRLPPPAVPLLQRVLVPVGQGSALPLALLHAVLLAYTLLLPLALPPADVLAV